jgi:hypothetical protein
VGQLARPNKNQKYLAFYVISGQHEASKTKIMLVGAETMVGTRLREMSLGKRYGKWRTIKRLTYDR